jgi:hypothetical protein
MSIVLGYDRTFCFVLEIIIDNLCNFTDIILVSFK